jgi:hypothetical protein
MFDSASVTNLMLFRYVSRYGGDDAPQASRGTMNTPADNCVCYPFRQNCCTHCGFQASCVLVCCNPLSSWLSCVTFTHLLPYIRQQGHNRASTTDVMFRITLLYSSHYVHEFYNFLWMRYTFGLHICYEGCSNETHLTIFGLLKEEIKDQRVG